MNIELARPLLLRYLVAFTSEDGERYFLNYGSLGVDTAKVLIIALPLFSVCHFFG